MEEQAATLLAALKKPSTAVDHKLQLFNTLKSNIKHLRVPESAQAPIFECIKLAITATNSAALVSTGFSTLGHLMKRLILQNQTAILTHQSHKLLPILLDRLGDARESHRHAASQILADIWPFNHAEVEALIRDHAIQGTNPRAKEAAMQWLVKVSTLHNVIKVQTSKTRVTDEQERWPAFSQLRAPPSGEPRGR
jgi:CLIP-associating protein 1/2